VRIAYSGQRAVRSGQAAGPYGRATLKRVCLNIRNAPDGSQETTLNGACFKIGMLIGARQLCAGTVPQLVDAALAMPSHRNPPWDPANLKAKVMRAVEKKASASVRAPVALSFALLRREDGQILRQFDPVHWLSVRGVVQCTGRY
jgi:hypothetical protein